MAVLYFLFGLMFLIMPLMEPTDIWANDLLKMTGGISLISAAIVTMVFQYERFIIPILKKEGSRFLGGATMLLIALVTTFLSRAGVLSSRYTFMSFPLLVSGIALLSMGLIFGAIDVVRGRRRINDSARAETSPLSDPLNKELSSHDYLEISDMQSVTEKTTELLEDRDGEKQ